MNIENPHSHRSFNFVQRKSILSFFVLWCLIRVYYLRGLSVVYIKTVSIYQIDYRTLWRFCEYLSILTINFLPWRTKCFSCTLPPYPSHEIGDWQRYSIWCLYVTVLPCFIFFSNSSYNFLLLRDEVVNSNKYIRIFFFPIFWNYFFFFLVVLLQNDDLLF